MASILTIGGSPVSLTTGRVVLDKLHLKLKGIDALTFSVRGGPLPGRPDPFVGKTASLTIGGTLVFSGDVVSANPHDTEIGYLVQYQCLGLRNRMDWVPITDSNTSTDTAVYNAQPDNVQFYIAARAGRTVGQIVADVLTMATNATNLSNWGVGNYTSLSPPTLPSLTAADLALLTLIPPHEVYVQGERLGDAIQGFLGNDAPNVSMYVQPDGTLRFLDHRTFAAHTFTADSDPIERPVLSHDTSECFSRVEVRGQPLTVPVLVKWSDASLSEDFGCVVGGTTYTNATAKAAWVPADFQQPGTALDTGTVNTGTETTTTVTVTSSNASLTWGTNFWDQTTTGANGVVYLVSSTAGGLITQSTSRRIVSNTALTAGGTSTLTLDYPLAVTNYDTYTIQGNLNGLSLVYRKYKVTNTAIGNAMAQQFNYPVPWVTSSGNLAQLVSFPTTTIVYHGTEEPLQATYDASSSHIILYKPSALVFGGGSTTTVPDDIRALLAINQDVNVVYAPANTGYTPNYEGTFFTVDLASNTARAKTLVVTCSDWRDPTSLANMQAYAQDLLDSVKDTIYEGSIVYNDLYTPALTFGIAVNLTGSLGLTGWESPLTSFAGHPGLPVVEVEVDWPQDYPSQYRTTMHCTNRRAHYSASEFLRPARQYQPLGIDTGGGTWNLGFGGISGATSQEGLAAQSMSNAQNFATGSQEGLAAQSMNSAQNMNTGSQEGLADQTMDTARNLDGGLRRPNNPVAFTSDGRNNGEITGGTMSDGSAFQNKEDE